MADRPLATYFGLVTVLTAPFWVLGAFVHHELLPGLPVAALAVVCPILAAAILSIREGGRKTVAEMLRRLMDFSGAGRWLVPAMLINPALFGSAFFVSRLLGENTPDPTISAVSVAAHFALFLFGAALEEVGWSYALDRLQAHVRAWAAGLMLGVFWALWHIPALLQVGRPLDWIAWWCLWTVSARLVMVFLYNWSGASVVAVVIYHASSNLCWQLYPVSGSYFDPRVSGLVTFAFVFALMIWSGVMRRGGRNR